MDRGRQCLGDLDHCDREINESLFQILCCVHRLVFVFPEAAHRQSPLIADCRVTIAEVPKCPVVSLFPSSLSNRYSTIGIQLRSPQSPIQRAHHPKTIRSGRYMQVDLRGGDVLVPQ